MSNDAVNQTRRRMLIGATSVVGAVGVVGAAIPFVGSWNPSAKAKAAGAPVKYNVSKVEPGAMVTVEWRGKPVYILRHTQQSLDSLKKVEEMHLLLDPNSDQPQQPPYAKNPERAIKKEFSVLLGICTHLGCAPLFRPDVGAADLGGEKWQGGFFCPCHGSKYDLAGRVYTGVPAPLNLEVPPYRYESDSVIVIGEDQEA
ncbi:ubiquinol-cytochrome c reductase iron-sulfur subunit [Cellvibrio japonicus]|uniref:Ubiquinol-cytochrome c reductase iron-sulfur subunit n=1 Tax=Cellvibrio japonicus (strain Ueda107) TaxID=498211 RepID=B3PBL8_CELJU|nr:ubiquinol-cytochrome c reductase iron-sulfur subunit [Cellvibrio japonicus]ACE84541.1 ubiquinol-cytochrome c reductase, iron-sulfur subunit [Cellvibrio japonicus Ueda107]QEI13131.1 ubiquinol-cytochrome c reductase iron-sulfur subunit [Cellvibrio japonicus]QEI16705.1 ubiquinol-cytochrome c reductase iron-sulfur subunit [Cellvibrio japonicus]QEI20283.1 ubiquinol-cytochrome c reductase iron-sulfur subunit [Cellvibrio japonicus]